MLSVEESDQNCDDSYPTTLPVVNLLTITILDWSRWIRIERRDGNRPEILLLFNFLRAIVLFQAILKVNMKWVASSQRWKRPS